MRALLSPIFVLSLVLGFFGATGCAAQHNKDIAFDTAVAPGTSVSTYKTYAWAEAGTVITDPEGRWVPKGFDLLAEAKFVVDQELRKRGMTEAAESPDCYVAFLLGVNTEAQLSDLDKEGSTDTPTPDGGSGAILVVFVDAATERVVWVGTATGDIKNLEDEAAKARLEYAVKGVLRQMN